jgi:hypothetical protein
MQPRVLSPHSSSHRPLCSHVVATHLLQLPAWTLVILQHHPRILAVGATGPLRGGVPLSGSCYQTPSCLCVVPQVLRGPPAHHSTPNPIPRLALPVLHLASAGHHMQVGREQGRAAACDNVRRKGWRRCKGHGRGLDLEVETGYTVHAASRKPSRILQHWLEPRGVLAVHCLQAPGCPGRGGAGLSGGDPGGTAALDSWSHAGSQHPWKRGLRGHGGPRWRCRHCHQLCARAGKDGRGTACAHSLCRTLLCLPCCMVSPWLSHPAPGAPMCTQGIGEFFSRSAHLHARKWTVSLPGLQVQCLQLLTWMWTWVASWPLPAGRIAPDRPTSLPLPLPLHLCCTLLGWSRERTPSNAPEPAGAGGAGMDGSSSAHPRLPLLLLLRRSLLSDHGSVQAAGLSLVAALLSHAPQHLSCERAGRSLTTAWDAPPSQDCGSGSVAGRGEGGCSSAHWSRGGEASGPTSWASSTCGQTYSQSVADVACPDGLWEQAAPSAAAVLRAALGATDIPETLLCVPPLTGSKISKPRGKATSTRVFMHSSTVGCCSRQVLRACICRFPQKLSHGGAKLGLDARVCRHLMAWCPRTVQCLAAHLDAKAPPGSWAGPS